MKVSELIQNLMTMDPDRDILCLVAKDDQLRVYDTAIARNIWSVDIHGHWDEQKQAKGRRDEGRRANL